MKNEAHYRKLENMYHAAPCNGYYKPQLTVSEEQAEIILPVEDKFFHAAGAVHGSVYFKALDDAAFFSANSLIDDVFVLTTSFTIYMTRPISSGKMRAIGKVVNTTKNQFIAESILYDSDNNEIARGMGSFVRSKIALTEEIGYR